MARLGGDARFLNLPDLAAARDSAQVRRLWPADSLQSKLGQFISQFRPDLVLLARDWAGENGSLCWQVLRDDLLAAVRSAAAAPAVDLAIVAKASQAWSVSRVACDEGRGQGLTVPINDRHPRWKKSYADIAAEAAQAYASLAVQRRWWQQGHAPSYAIRYPAAVPLIKTLDEGAPGPAPSSLRGIEIQVEYLTERTLSGKTDGAASRASALIDSIEYTLARRSELPVRERRTLLDWKNGLENLRCTLLGVEVDYAISDALLTDRQLTYITFNNVKGLSREGKTEILFAGLDQGWAVNENVPQKLPFNLNEEYRLLTPGDLTYNFPPAQTRFQLTPYAKSAFFFIIHRAKLMEQSFIYRGTINFSFAPKFVAEVLTPIVRMTPGERIVLRLMNISRDGVADTLEVVDSLAQSFRHPFRLSNKGDSKIDTLQLAWVGDPPEGTYLIPVEIDSVEVAQFAARKFRAEVSGAKRLGLLAGIQNSPTAEALRRLNVAFATIAPNKPPVQQIESLGVLIIDRRALTLQPQIAAWRPELDRFVDRGGHLIILAQDPAAWNAAPLWADVQLKPASIFSHDTPVHAAAGHAMLVFPNPIAAEDWQEWLFLRAYNFVSLPATNGVEIPLRAAPGGEPLLITVKMGQGRKTYVDLALNPQLMNVHAGAFRLLANLISL
jgi:hypothetical protein